MTVAEFALDKNNLIELIYKNRYLSSIIVVSNV